MLRTVDFFVFASNKVMNDPSKWDSLSNELLSMLCIPPMTSKRICVPPVALLYDRNDENYSLSSSQRNSPHL